MSMRKKLLEAASFAVEQERGRVLWLIDQIGLELERGTQDKLLTEAQLHATKVRLQIFRALAVKLKRGVISGVQPPPVQVKEPERGSEETVVD